MADHQPPTSGDAASSDSGETPEQTISVDVDYDRRINFAMQQNDVPVVKLLRVTNRGAELLENLTLNVWIDHDLAPKTSVHIARIAGGETWNLETLDLPLDSAVLATQEEREAASLHVEVKDGERTLGNERVPVAILSFNE